MLVRTTLKEIGPITQEQIDQLKALEDRPIDFSDIPELTEEELKKLRRVGEINHEKRKKQTVSLRLSPQALQKARSLGSGYTSVLARMLEIGLNDKELIERCM